MQEIQPGGILFVDDYFINMNKGDCPVRDILEDAAALAGCSLKEYKTYAPFARAFVVLKEDKK
jgi:hypothetical protein